MLLYRTATRDCGDLKKTMPSATPKLGISKSARITSVYGAIKDQVGEVLVGQYKIGERLPSERQLARDFSVSPQTIARALQELSRDGVIYRVPGSGTYLSEAAALPAASSERAMQG